MQLLTYPKVNSLMNFEAVPEQLKFITNSINGLLERVHYDELFFSVTQDESAGFYSLTLLLNEKLGFDIPGTGGMSIKLNPLPTPITGYETAIPVEISYNIGIWQFIRRIKVTSVAEVPDLVFDILLKLSSADKVDMLRQVCEVIIGGSDPVQDLVNNINTNYNPSPLLVVPLNNSNKYLNLYQQISANNIYIDIPKIILTDYLITGTVNQALDKIKLFFRKWLGGITFKDILRQFIPNIHFYISSINIGVEFPLKVFRRIDPVTYEPMIDAVTGNFVQTVLIVDIGGLHFDTSNGFDFETHTNVDFPLSEIGRTGLLLKILDLKFDFSKTKNLPEAYEDGRSDEFVGVYVEQVDIILPKKWFKEENAQTLKISGQKLLIGTGGISGTIAIQTINNTPPQNDDYFWFKLGKDPNKAWRLGFNKFDITFKQNAVTSSNIKGALEIPKFKKTGTSEKLHIDLDGHLAEDGDFSLTAVPVGGVQANLFDYVHFNFLSFELGREDDNFYVGTSCEINFTNGIMKKLLGNQVIKIPKVRIYSNGRIEIVTGNAFLAVNLSLHLGPIDLAVTGIYFGSYQQTDGNGVQRNYNYFGLDGAISIGPLGVDAKGKGIKYYFTVDNDELGPNGQPLEPDNFIRVETIELDLVIPGSANPASAIAIIHGAVSIPQPGLSPEYYGEISLKIPKLKIAGGAGMRLAPRYPAFIIDAFIDLPAPIPLGPVGIYGFRGLLGYRYVAEKEAAGLVSGVNTWYEYYKTPPKGIHIQKFSGPERTKNYTFPFSIGAGAVLGTSFDSGKIVSVRAMLLLSIPTLFMIEGRASILASRLELTDDREPPFFAFVAWGDNSIELGIGADFKLQSNGWIVELYAEVQAGFFFNNPSRWYVNFGTKQQPITARVVSILTAQTYLMLSSKGIEAGARVEFDLNKHFGPAKVHIYAYVEIGGHISFERPQIGGYLALGGMIDIEIWIVGITIGLDAMLSVEASKPFLLYAELRIKVCVRIIVKVCKSFTIELKWEKDSTVDRTPIQPLPYTTTATQLNRAEELVKAVNMLTNEAFAVKYHGTTAPGEQDIVSIIPMDSYIDIKAAKGLIPNPVDAMIGGHTTGAENFTDLISPESISRNGRQLRQVKHTYSIESIEIKAWNGSQWIDYHPYQAIIEGENVTGFKIGYWQRSGNQYDTIRLLATTPFSYTEAGEPGWFIPEQYGINPSTLFCAMQLEQRHCSDVLNKPIGTIYYPPQQYVAHFINGAYYTITGGTTYDPSNAGIAGLSGDYMKVTNDANPFGMAKSLAFNNYNSLVIFLPDPSVETVLRFTTNASGADVSYYKKLVNDATAAPQYQLLQTVHKTTTELMQPLTYNNYTTPIAKIVISPTSPNPRIAEINAEIAALFNNTYEAGSGQVNVNQPIDMVAYEALLTELAQISSQGCTSEERFFFSNFYGYLVSSGITQSLFNNFLRCGDFYLATVELQTVNDTLGANTSLLLKINATGQVIAEKIIQGIINNIRVANGEIYISLAVRYTIDYWLEIPMLLKLDMTLNQVGGLELSPVFNGTRDMLCTLENNRYLFWFGSHSSDRMVGGGASFTNGTRLILVDTLTMTIADQKLLSGDMALKVVPKDENSCVFITTPSWLGYAPPGVCYAIAMPNGTLTINVGNFGYGTYLSDVIVLNDGRIAVTGRSAPANSVFIGMYLIDPFHTTATLYTYYSATLANDDLYLGGCNLQQDGILLMAYSTKGVFLFTEENGLTLKHCFRVSEPPSIPVQLLIHKMDHNRATGEVYMACGQPAVVKGGILTVMNENLDSCMLGEVSVAPTYGTATIGMNHESLNPAVDPTLSYTAVNMIAPSNYIIDNNTICPLVTQPGTTPRCTTSLQKLCWLTVAQHEYNATIPEQPAIDADHGTMVAAMQRTAQPIWRPNTKFYVHFRLKDTVDNGSSTPGIYDYYYGFKTTGPVGHYVPPGTNANHPLASLRQYIDYNRSYPNADGNLLQAKPLFYGNDECKISIFFAYAFAYHMLQKWYAYNGMPELSGEMHIAIKDPVTDVVIPYPLPVAWTNETVPLPNGDEEWSGDDDPRIPHNIQVLNNMIDHVNENNDIYCTLTIGTPIKPKAYTYSVTLTNLAPRKLYTALLYNAFEVNSNNDIISKKVHEFVFETSRYANFEEQVNSYIMKDDAGNQKPAVFKIPLTLTAAKIDTAYNIIAGIPDVQSDALQTRYAHAFDRVTEGLFGFRPNDPAVTTEFNVLKDITTGDTIGVLVRNPEPFNIPKIPVEEIAGTITVLGQGALPDADYKVLYSKDYAQALIMHTSKKITAPGLSFRFIYKTWNGTAYVPGSSIITSPVALNI